ncbi:lipopolysaccharide biosynthesis protein [Pseudomonas gregormendelii]
MSFLKKASGLSLLNLSTAAVSLIWIPVLINFLGIESYGGFVLATTIASILYSLLYINSWQWLLIKYKDNHFQSTNIALISDFIFTGISIGIALQIDNLNLHYNFLSEEQLPILKSYLIGFSISHVSIYTALFRSKEKFNEPAIIALLSEMVRAAIIVTTCTVTEDKASALTMLGYTLWLFGMPHAIANIYCILKSKSLNSITKFDFISYFKYNCYLHPKNMSDLLINHFDKIIITINQGPAALAIYDLLKKLGYAVSKLLSPVYPIVFGDLVSGSRDGKTLRSKCNSYLKQFSKIALGLYACFELTLLISPALPIEKSVIDAIISYQYEIRLYILCHLLGFAFCAYHLVLSASGNTKTEFYITTIANIAFIALFYMTTKHSLLLGIIAILLQYSGLILAKVWITRKII